MTIDVVQSDDRWSGCGLTELAERSAQRTLSHLGLDVEAFEIAVLGCDDARIAGLNGDFRGKAQPTNVLSWPSEDRAADVPGGTPAAPAPGALGDIAIAYETCVHEAGQQGKAVEAHISHLLVHAVLHLLGYDHMNAQDAALMESLEVEILATLGHPDPY